GGIEEVIPPSPKKRKVPTVQNGRTLALLSSSTAPASDLDCSDKDIPAADADLGVVPSPSSHVVTVVTSVAPPSFWDPMFNPVEFVERQLCMRYWRQKEKWRWLTKI
ncbi:hypothetical protein A2U01_0061893, partial [Trifolium medium]|nr:hypothetical protein [Trifolium medium]